MGLLKSGAVFGLTLFSYDLGKAAGREKLGLKGDILPAVVGGVVAVAVGALATGVLK